MGGAGGDRGEGHRGWAGGAFCWRMGEGELLVGLGVRGLGRGGASWGRRVWGTGGVGRRWWGTCGGSEGAGGFQGGDAHVRWIFGPSVAGWQVRVSAGRARASLPDAQGRQRAAMDRLAGESPMPAVRVERKVLGETGRRQAQDLGHMGLEYTAG